MSLLLAGVILMVAVAFNLGRLTEMSLWSREPVGVMLPLVLFVVGLAAIAMFFLGLVHVLS